MANFTLVSGRLVADPEIRKTANNDSVLRFRIAHNHPVYNGGKPRTTYLQCEAWGTGAEVIAKYFRKGDPILVQGFLRQDEWTDKDGNNHSQIVMRVERHERPLGSSSRSRSEEPRHRRDDGRRRDDDEELVAIEGRHEEDDIPF